MSKTPGVSGMPVVLPSCAGSGNGWVLVRWGRGASDHIAFLGPPYTPLAPPSLLALTLVQLSSIPPILTIAPSLPYSILRVSETLSQPALPHATLTHIPYY